MKHLFIFCLVFLFLKINDTHAQVISVEQGITWNTVSVRNSNQYQSAHQWDRGRQTSLWLRLSSKRKTSILLGTFWGDRDMYLTRMHPEFSSETLAIPVKRNVGQASFLMMVEHPIVKLNRWDVLLSAGGGFEFTGAARQYTNDPDTKAPVEITYHTSMMPFIVVMGKTGVTYHISKRWNAGITGTYTTRGLAWVRNIPDHMVTQSLSVNLRVGFAFGRETTPF